MRSYLSMPTQCLTNVEAQALSLSFDLVQGPSMVDGPDGMDMLSTLQAMSAHGGHMGSLAPMNPMQAPFPQQVSFQHPFEQFPVPRISLICACKLDGLLGAVFLRKNTQA